MGNKVKVLIKCGVGFGIIIFIILQMIFKSKSIISNVSTSISITTISIIIYCNYLWRYVPKSISKLPKLFGSWEGVIKSSYDGFDKEYKFKINIKQTLINTYIQFSSEESDSTSVTCEIIKNGKDNYILIYSYSNEPHQDVKDRSEIHYGTAKLKILDDKELEGGYFTDRKTTGTMSLKKIS